jgi:ribosomal-protein-alanine N-acetyltransferase
MNVVDLRVGRVDDLPDVDRIMREAFDPRFGEAWSAGQCAGVMALPGVRLTVASIDGLPAGFTILRTILEEAELLLLAVRPALRRRGIGRALLRAAITDCASNDVTKLHLEVRAGNEAIVLYSAAGFTKIGERRGYYRGKTGKMFDALTFQKTLR